MSITGGLRRSVKDIGDELGNLMTLGIGVALIFAGYAAYVWVKGGGLGAAVANALPTPAATNTVQPTPANTVYIPNQPTTTTGTPTVTTTTGSTPSTISPSANLSIINPPKIQITNK